MKVMEKDRIEVERMTKRMVMLLRISAVVMLLIKMMMRMMRKECDPQRLQIRRRGARGPR